MRLQNLKDYSLPDEWSRGKNIFIEFFWQVFFKGLVSSHIPGTAWRKLLLIIFGAQLGKRIRLSPGLKVKMPWRLIIGDFSWIGEDTWIDNLSLLTIGNNVCISQGVFFCTGNHNFKKSTFNLTCRPIFVDSQSWVGAKCIIGPGVRIGKGSVVSMGAIVKYDIPPQSLLKNNLVKENYFL